MSKNPRSYKNIRFGRVDIAVRKQAPLDIAQKIFARSLADYTEIDESRQQLFINQISTMDKARFMHMPTLAAVFVFMNRHGIIPKIDVDFVGSPTTPGTVAYNIQAMSGVITPKNIDPFIDGIPEYNKNRTSKKRKSKVLTDANIRANFYALFVRYMFEIVSPDRVEPPEEITQSALAIAKEQSELVGPDDSSFSFSYDQDNYKPIDDDDIIEQENEQLDKMYGEIPSIPKQQIPGELPKPPPSTTVLPLPGPLPLPSISSSIVLPLPGRLVLPQISSVSLPPPGGINLFRRS